VDDCTPTMCHAANEGAIRRASERVYKRIGKHVVGDCTLSYVMLHMREHSQERVRVYTSALGNIVWVTAPDGVSCCKSGSSPKSE
jgi:hypothetical protein